jgi:hypothetical protein
VARSYRELTGDERHVRGGAAISERDTRVVRQVLIVVT